MFDSDSFGLWAMFAFWGSAIGGVFLAIQWANRKSKKSPAPKDVILKSLQQRLERGEISEEECQQRLKNL
ncbi:MAG: SHOCT domain-containing protein [Cycloclasticus sp.]